MTVDPLAYPFAAPPESFVLGEGGREGRTIVLAYGANGSPEVLRRKLGDDVSLEAVPGTLHDFDVVYSAHISPYGAVPATLHRVAGRAVAAWALFVTDAQLERLAQTEPNYTLHRLTGLAFEPADTLLAFISRHGALAVEGAPVRLADRGQQQVQELVRARLAPSESLEEFVAQNARDPDRATRFTAVLRRDGIPFGDV